MEYKELKAFIQSASNDELAAMPGHVTQVWHDGEITIQKSGDLLGQRTLHTVRPGLECEKLSMPPGDFQHQNQSGNGFIYCTPEDAATIRDAIFERAKLLIIDSL